MVIIFLGSNSDLEIGQSIEKYLDKLEVLYKLHIASAHKTPEYLLRLLKHYESLGKPIVYICIAGRSNALGGFVDAHVVHPVINCPPYSEKYAGLDVLSSLRMPSGVAATTVLEPEQAALAAAKILGLSDKKILQNISNYQKKSSEKVIKDDKDALRDKCGVFGIYAPGKDVAQITYLAVHSLQHRGQESAGITVSDGETFRSIRKLGLVTSVFNEENISKLKGFLAIGHNRYSTTGGNTIENVQPVIIPNGGDSLAVSHNGNLVNSLELSKKLKKNNMVSTTDTAVLALLICQNEAKTWDEKITNTLTQAKGAYSIVAATKRKLFAFRDPWGIRPLVIGIVDGNFVVASETCALDTIGAKYIRDVALGEIIAINDKGVKTVSVLPKQSKKFCLFEYVYLARPDSVMNDVLVHKARQRSGKILAKEAPVEADMVVAVPDSGTSAAIGFAQSTGIAYGEALIKNRYIGRTFIAPDQRIREQNVKMKFNPMKEIVMGKSIVIVDDSIVRGTTMKKIVEVLRSCGAKKIHLRICSPPIRWPCFFGVDTPERKQLIASKKTVSEIKKFIGADSLHYLSLGGLIEASGQPKDSLCGACFSGNYPMKVDLNFTKKIFENYY